LQSTENQSGHRAERLNYFNYFTEVEEEFVRRRGKQLLISPMDWALVESWKSAGIPLHIVLRAINESFDAYDARAQKYRKVNSIFYCQQAVESAFADYRLSQVGGGAPANESLEPEQKTPDADASKSEAFPKEVIQEFLARSDAELGQASQAASVSGRTDLEDAIARARARVKEIMLEISLSNRVNAEAIERDLDAIDRMILECAAKSCGEEELKSIRAEAAAQLRSYRKKMDKTIYEQTLQNFVSRRLRDMNKIPRLSLFYL